MSLVAAVLVAATFTRSLERVNSMDPIMSQSAYDARAVRLVYETPLEIDYEARPYRLAPGLCELPEVSSDGLVYTLRVRPDSRRRTSRIRSSDCATWTAGTARSAGGRCGPSSRSKPVRNPTG